MIKKAIIDKLAVIITICFLLCGAPHLAMADIGMQADESPTITSGHMELISDMAEPATLGIVFGKRAAIMSLPDTPVSLKNGNYEKWIERIDIPENMRDFYEELREGSDNDGVDDWLISDAAYAQESRIILTDTGEVHYDVVQDNLNSILLQKAKEYQSMYNPYFLAVYSAFDRDCEEVFWLRGIKTSIGLDWEIIDEGICEYMVTYRFLLYSKNSNGSVWNVRKDDYWSEEQIRNEIAKRDEAVEAILSECGVQTEQRDDIKLRLLHNWLVKHNEYNTSGNLSNVRDDCYECLSAIYGKTGLDGPVCEGYARAFKALCDAIEIPCVLVDGNAKASLLSSGESHMWNYVMLDGAWYAVDCTWDDPLVYYSGTTGTADSGNENDEFFLVGSATVIENLKFLQSHSVTNQVFQNAIAFPNGPVLSETEYLPCSSPFLVGDVNGDGTVDAADRVLLSRYLANWNGVSISVPETADVNADGKIDGVDRMILTRYLAKWNGYNELPHQNESK